MVRALNKKRSWFWHPLVTLVLVLVAIFATRSAARLHNAYESARSIRDKEQSRVADLDFEYSQIMARLDKIQTPEGFEREVKDRYRVARDGEELVVIVPAEEEIAVDAGDETSVPDEKKWFGWFRGIFRKGD